MQNLGPLKGVRVIDFSHQAAGPWCTTLLGDMVSIDLSNGTKLNAAALAGSKINYRARKPGALNPSPGQRKFEMTYVVAGLVYGLVNVRTDGDTILCATMNEGDGSWSFKTFKSRF